MDLKAQNNQTRSQTPAPAAAPTPVQRAVAPEKKPKSLVAKIVGGVIILLVVVAVVYGAKMLHDPTRAVDSSKFQAIFLSNGQVYFGKIKSLDGKYAKISNIYYLQVQQLQKQDTNEDTEGEAANGESSVSLTKLGSELHGPEDEMHISSDQILFWENLKDESRVVKTITEFEAKK